MKNNTKMILKYVRKYKVFMFGLILTILINGFLSTYPIKLIQRLIDSSASGKVITSVLFWGSIYFLTQVLWLLSGGFVSWISTQLEIKIGHQIRCDLFKKIEHLPLTYFDNNTSGDMLIRLVQDSSVTVDGILKPITFITLNVFQFILGFYFISTINWKITFIMLPIGLGLVLLSIKTGGKIRHLSNLHRDSIEELWNKFLDGIRNVKILKAFVKEEMYYSKVEKSSQNVKLKSKNLAIYTLLIDRAYSTLFMLLIAFIMVFGSIQVKLGVLSIGGLSALMMYNGILIDPMLNFFDFYQQLQQIFVSTEKIFEILKLEEENNNCRPIVKNTFTDKITINKLNFAYSDRKVLKNVSLDINKGDHIAIVGLSGSGKSTIFNLLMGFYSVKPGTIYIDGLDILNIKLEALRELFGIVFQDSQLFQGSIRENLLFADGSASDDKIFYALEMAELKELVSKLPESIDTCIGENGTNLSGGERQRLSLARLFLQSPEVLILDEALSAIDSINSMEITGNIINEFKDKTLVFAVHKLNGIVEKCDKVIVFSDGELVCKGSHIELLEKSQMYRNLYFVK